MKPIFLALPFPVLLSLSLGAPSSAEVLRGQITALEPHSVYLQLSPSTVAKIPRKNSVYRLHGQTLPLNELRVGQHVEVEYSPLHGLQRYYHTSSDLEGSRTVFILSDADPNDTSAVDWEGDLYQPVEP